VFTYITGEFDAFKANVVKISACLFWQKPWKPIIFTFSGLRRDLWNILGTKTFRW